jgi:hypothetical protein
MQQQVRSPARTGLGASRECAIATEMQYSRAACDSIEAAFVFLGGVAAAMCRSQEGG